MRFLFSSILLLLMVQHIYPQDKGERNIYILGIAQDGGYPHAGCNKVCCAPAWQNDSVCKYVVSFALVDSASKKWWLFEATPDIKFQLRFFRALSNGFYNYLPDGIFITHAHIGHYAGLMEFGKEVMGTNEILVYVLPRMKKYLETNGPWSQLVKLNNIVIHQLNEGSVSSLSEKIQVEVFLVPHRDEYTETGGFKISAGRKKYLFIPDIDKWEKWSRNIIDQVKAVDVALLDGTFYRSNELPDRKISEVPHPLVSETMELFKNEGSSTNSKIFFIHFNHTNPLMSDDKVRIDFRNTGFNLEEQGQIF